MEEYRYDHNGNRVYEMNTLSNINDMHSEYSIEDYLLTVGDSIFEHDLDDNHARKIKCQGITEYNNGSTCELLSVTLLNNTTIEYVNTPFGRRIAKKNNGTIIEKYFTKNFTTLLMLYDGNDNLCISSEYADDRLSLGLGFY